MQVGSRPWDMIISVIGEGIVSLVQYLLASSVKRSVNYSTPVLQPNIAYKDEGRSELVSCLAGIHILVLEARNRIERRHIEPWRFFERVDQIRGDALTDGFRFGIFVGIFKRQYRQLRQSRRPESPDCKSRKGSNRRRGEPHCLASVDHQERL